jgi:hypothetical protein
LGELFNVYADVSSRVITAVSALTMEDAQFFRVGLRGLDTHHVFCIPLERDRAPEPLCPTTLK